MSRNRWRSPPGLRWTRMSWRPASGRAAWSTPRCTWSDRLMLHAMIMAGGGGTRFWPRSRSARPKQFLTFTGDRTLLQGTFDRIEAQVPAARTWVITGEPNVAEARRQLPELPADHVVGEPCGRDTAPC